MPDRRVAAWCGMVWVGSPEFPKYQVSHRGWVRNARTKHLLATRLIKGYRFTNVYGLRDRKTVAVSRMVLSAFVGPPPPGHTADHVKPSRALDDDYRNLRWATHADQNLNRRRPTRSRRDPRPDLPGETWRLATRKDGSAFPADPMVDVSQYGRVRRRYVHKPAVVRAAADFLTPRSAGGYPIVTVCDKKRKVHELVATAWLGPCQPGRVINHVDHDKTNAAVVNLEYVTPAENALAAIQAGRCDHAKTRCIPVTVAGTRFVSMSAASKATGMRHRALKRLASCALGVL